MSAAKQAGISRQVVYDWRKLDEAFKQQWDDIIESSGEAVEKTFYSEFCLGERANTGAIIFYLKCKRGWKEASQSADSKEEIIINNFIPGVPDKSHDGNDGEGNNDGSD